MRNRLEVEFPVKGRRLRGTREGVEKALQGVEPEKVRLHWVSIGGRRYPVRQAFAVAFGLRRRDVVTSTAVRVLRRLGFEVLTRPGKAGAGEGGGGGEAGTEPRYKPRFPYTAWMPKTAELQRLDVRAIELYWSEWHRWEDLAGDARGTHGTPVPEGTPGVYEVKLEGQQERLVIGRTSDLWVRVKQSLVRGYARHEGGARIRANEDLPKVRVRWAVTERPAAAEEELHQQHMKRFGRLPKYTEHT